MKSNWIDRAVGYISPHSGLRRARARVAAEMLARNYEAASTGRRTQNWRKAMTDANGAIESAGASLRSVARDLVRNNPYAEKALSVIVNNTVGWGIVAKSSPKNRVVDDLWDRWANTTACDADGVHDLAGLQKLVLRTVAQDGACLVRRRLRRPEDGLPIPIQIQILECDYLDTGKQIGKLPNGGRIVNGIEFGPFGKRVAYWLFNEHPGSNGATITSSRVLAENIEYVYDAKRPGQNIGASWYAPVLLRFKDFDEFEDATLMKQKIAACLAVITSDVDGTGTPLGTADSSDLIDSLEPGAILNVPSGRTVNVVSPPSVGEYSDYTKTALHAIATGMRITYEDLTSDYSQVNFSSARMARIQHWASVEDWRWRMLIPQFCDPVWAWAMQAAAIVSGIQTTPSAAWTAPPIPMLEPDKEGLAYQRNIRNGIISWPEAVRERGYDPDDLLAEITEWNKKLDKAGVVLDCDPRKMSAAGQMQGAPAAPALPAAPAEDEEEEEGRSRLRLA